MKWEYMTLLNGTKLTDATLNKVGADRWELIAIDFHPGHYDYLFKRPISETSMDTAFNWIMKHEVPTG